VNLGYQLVLARDATAGVDDEYVDAVYANTLSLLATVTTTADVLDVWARTWRAVVDDLPVRSVRFPIAAPPDGRIDRDTVVGEFRSVSDSERRLVATAVDLDPSAVDEAGLLRTEVGDGRRDLTWLAHAPCARAPC
jgi:hypothetical protein